MSSSWAPSFRGADLDTIRLGLPVVGLRLDHEPRPASGLADALVHAVAELLDDRPCFVEFSGGCDSSLVLAAAVRACRITGHQPPIAVTFRYPSTATFESGWQELVARHLGIDEWIVVELGDGESDVLGPTAAALLKSYGTVFPATTFGRAAAFARVGAGLLLSGEGGDEVLGRRRVSGALVAARTIRHGRMAGGRALTAAALDLLPRNLRRGSVKRSLRTGFQPLWLDDDHAEVVLDHLADEVLATPLSPARFMDHHLRTVRLGTALTNLRACAGLFGLQWEAPLLSSTFASAVSATPWHHFTGRNDILDRYFADWLPHELVWRRSKAGFHEVYFGPHTRAFAAEWDGTGAPAGVRADWLKEHWSTAPMVFASTGLLLQHLWLQQNTAEPAPRMTAVAQDKCSVSLEPTP